MMAVETVVAGSLRRWAAGFAVWVLLAHTLVTACVPAPLLLLSQHDHVVIGKISARQWAAHLQWHLHEVNHHFIPTEPDPSVPTRDTGTILSVAGCDMNALQAFYVTMRGTTCKRHDAGAVGPMARSEGSIGPAARAVSPATICLAHPHTSHQIHVAGLAGFSMDL